METVQWCFQQYAALPKRHWKVFCQISSSTSLSLGKKQRSVVGPVPFYPRAGWNSISADNSLNQAVHTPKKSLPKTRDKSSITQSHTILALRSPEQTGWCVLNEEE